MAIDYELKEVFDISKFTVVGSPSITVDGIASGFSASNYLDKQINYFGDKLWQIKLAFTTSDDIATEQGIFGNSTAWDNGLFLRVNNGNLSSVWFVNDGTLRVIYDGVVLSNIQTNTKYYIILEYDGVEYYNIYTSTDDINFTRNVHTSSNLEIETTLTTWKLGYVKNNLPFTGSIDLKQFSITVDGVEVFKGTKTVVAKIPPDIISGKSIPVDYKSMLDELQNYYANLLIIQYHNKPKAVGMIKSLVRALFADMILFKIRDGFNLVNQPYAQGVQLDCLGEWVGVNRIYDAGQPLYPWFSLIDAEQTTADTLQGGFQDWDDTIAQDGGFLGFDDLIMGGNKTALTDDLFLALIKMKIIKNSSTHTMGDLDRKLYEYFGSDIYITWDGMEMTYNYVNKYASVMIVAQNKNALPIVNGMVCKLNPL